MVNILKLCSNVLIDNLLFPAAFDHSQYWNFVAHDQLTDHLLFLAATMVNTRIVLQ